MNIANRTQRCELAIPDCLILSIDTQSSGPNGVWLSHPFYRYAVRHSAAMDVVIRIPEELVTDTLIAAIEGGIQYWCSYVVIKSADRLWVAFRESDDGAVFEITKEDWPRIVALMANEGAPSLGRTPRQSAEEVRGWVGGEVAGLRGRGRDVRFAIGGSPKRPARRSVVPPTPGRTPS